MSENTTTTTSDQVKPSVRFPDVPRLFSVSELAKVLDIAPGTIANNVLDTTGTAPAPDFIVGERMVWTSVEPWNLWVKERAEAKERKARENAEKEASKIRDFASKISAESKSELVKALLAGMTPEQIAELASE